ncbi:hypothetical protein C8Q76DRAFT_710115 [Earliella scabrosa]|nr:hypothetical protein C8Q76DRAFT_710115 [Earliella scabrosa]
MLDTGASPGDSVHPDYYDPLEEEEPSWISTNAMAAMSPSSFPDGTLRFLVDFQSDSYGLPPYGFVDLAGSALSPEQIIERVSSIPNVSALDLSNNSRIVAADIPHILKALPTLRRLIIMGCEAVEERRLIELIRQQPYSFRTIEGLMHPSLLSITKAADFPIAFTFIYANEASLGGASLPFFTPDMVLRALLNILPLAWSEQYMRDSMQYQRDLEDWVYKVGPLSSNFDMSALMIAYAVFTSGSYGADSLWGSRPVVSVPLQPHAVVSDDPSGNWAFCLHWEQDNDWRKWGFIRYAPEYTPSKSNEDVLYRRGKVYDLHGFLQHMSDEGRPPPNPELVRRIEEVLDAKHQPDGQHICSIMDDCDVPRISSKVHQTGYNHDHDLYIRREAVVLGFASFGPEV